MTITSYTPEQDAMILQVVGETSSPTAAFNKLAELWPDKTAHAIGSRHYRLTRGKDKPAPKKKNKSNNSGKRWLETENVIIRDAFRNTTDIHASKMEAHKLIPHRTPKEILVHWYYINSPGKRNAKPAKNQAKGKGLIHVPKNNTISVHNSPHRRPGAPVSLALEFAEMAVGRLTYDEKLLLAKTILDSEQ